MHTPNTHIECRFHLKNHNKPDVSLRWLLPEKMDMSNDSESLIFLNKKHFNFPAILCAFLGCGGRYEVYKRCTRLSRHVPEPREATTLWSSLQEWVRLQTAICSISPWRLPVFTAIHVDVQVALKWNISVVSVFSIEALGLDQNSQQCTCEFNCFEEVPV